MNERNADGLRSLSLSRLEFEQTVWPELPSSRPEMNLPVDYAWGELQQKSLGYLATLLAEEGGRRYELISLSFEGETTEYRTFTVHRRSVLQVRDEQGRQQTLRAFGSMLERDGRYKIFSYVVD